MSKKQYRTAAAVLVGLLLLSFFVLIYCITRSSIEKSIDRNIALDMQSVSLTQASVIDHKIQHEFSSLEEIVTQIEKGFDFSNPANATMLETVVECRDLCMLALADHYGNAVNYRGEEMGNVSDRDYFQQIISGKEAFFCQYLENPAGADEPRLVFAMPIEKNGEIAGVLFAAKGSDELERTLFSDQVFSGYVDLFIVDGDGRIIARHVNLEGFSLESADEDRFFVETTPLNIRDWSLICAVDKNAPIEEYEGITKAFQQLVATISFIATVFLAVCLLSYLAVSRHEKKEKDWLEYNYNNCMKVLEKMKCAIVEYDIASGTIESNSLFEELFSYHALHGSVEAIEAFHKAHPEFSLSELKKSVEMVIEERNPLTTNSYLILDEKTIWLNILLIPIIGMDEKVTQVLAAIQDVTGEHEKMEEALSMIRQIPGGIHRCHLSDPIHLEYAGDGMLEMLGYTREEFDALIGPEQQFIQCIAEEDRARFAEFIRGLAAEEKTDVCSYLVVRKDGTRIPVLDTMESKRSSAGVMVGYSVLTDNSNFVEKNLSLEKELESTKELLKKTRIRVSTSQMQPHFLYNALSSIRELVLDDPEYAADLIYDFTVHLRACIKSMSNDDLVSFRQEMENLRAYTEIEKMRLGNKLKIDIRVSGEDFFIIPLGIQPIVENSIRHGIYPKGAAGGTVTVREYAQEDCRVIEVSDDGIGFDPEKVNQQIASGEKDSTGLFNIIYRFEQLMHASVSVSSRIGEGTTVTIRIPMGEEKTNENDCG